MPELSVTWIEYNVQSLLTDLRQGKLGLPEFQRGWRWTSTRIRDYLDSLYRQYPSGILLLWEPLDREDLNLRDFAIDAEGSLPTDRLQYLVLDGQQRLTSLWKVVEGDVLMRFNPLQEAFQSENAANRRSPEWLPVCEALQWDIDEADEELDRRFPREKRKDVRKALAKLQKIRDYPYRAYVLKTDDYEAVVESFMRVNSGVRLRQAELAMASLLLGIPGFYQEEIDDLQIQLEEMDFALDTTVVMRFLAAVLAGEARLLQLRRRLKELREDDRVVRQAWSKMKRGLNAVMADLLSDGLSRSQLPSINVLVPLVYYRSQHQHLSERDRNLLRAWFYLASAKQRFAGAVETTLSEDMRGLQERGTKGLIDNLRRLPGGLSIESTELEGPYYRHPFLLLMYALVRAEGGKDLFTGANLLPRRGTPRAFTPELHHVFPKRFLTKRVGLGERDADELANIAFLAQQSNRELSDSPPEDYLGEVDRSRLESQLIPSETRLWRGTEEGYRMFLEKRRKLLVDAMNQFVTNLVGD